MILRHVVAENILKYRRLRIADLPAKGQIAIAGPNEAGKTAIGETICFGLFGRTFSLGPGETAKVIRWGEYNGSVSVGFVGSDGGEYRVVREVDNTGKHQARLFIEGEAQPVAEGVEDVEEALRELGGFSYLSFVDSFYLAQREMEVPHGKSATVKALIGVDKLEKAAAELEAESTETAAEIRTLESRVRQNKQKVAEINLDRAHLGRLEAQCDAKRQAAAAATAESAELAARAESIGRAATGVLEAARQFAEMTSRTNYGQWRARKETVASSFVAAVQASQVSGLHAESRTLEHAGAAIKPFDDGLAGYDRVRSLANLYRQRLVYLLDETATRANRRSSEEKHTRQSEMPFAVRRASCVSRIEGLTNRRRAQWVVGVFGLVLAAACWASWLILRVSPESSTAGLLRGVLAMSDAARHWLMLSSALVATALSGVFLTLAARTSRELRDHRRRLAEIERETQIAKVEIGVIDAIEEVAMPDALNALRGVRNDLLHSAVASYADGDGAVFVRQDALSVKLGALREGGTQAAQALRAAQKRIANRSSDLKRQVMELEVEIERLEADVAAERQRCDQVEALERTVASLETKVNDLHHGIVVRRVSGELIDGACRRIYSRFHPELRRFVGRILPRLTDDRYEHLEVDDDLRVRVFCKEKNDFVGLAEISNGTHRQLMLCVRLALSQALIASSSKSAQFLFFDEPFAFFDEHRMAKAIDVLGKISPQITQVWLAAQKFDNPSAFDLVLNCEVNGDELEVSGNARVH